MRNLKEITYSSIPMLDEIINKSKTNPKRNEYFFEKMFLDNRFNRLNLKSNSNIINFVNRDSIFDFLSSKDKLSPLNSLINIERP